jgi:hypothetical protein
MSRKLYTVEYSITGRAVLEVEADSAEEARAIADRHEDGDEVQVVNVEWEYEDVVSVRENPS